MTENTHNAAGFTVGDLVTPNDGVTWGTVRALLPDGVLWVEVFTATNPRFWRMNAKDCTC